MITIKRYPFDRGYYKIIFNIPLCPYCFTWSRYAEGWYGLRITK